MRRKITPREYHQSLAAMERDLHRMQVVQHELNTVRAEKVLPETLNGLQAVFPIPREMSMQAMVGFWRQKVDDKIEEIQTLKQQTLDHLERMKNKPFRCALPKKKQRELGLL
jgi:hypothetical protein